MQACQVSWTLNSLLAQRVWENGPAPAAGRKFFSTRFGFPRLRALIVTGVLTRLVQGGIHQVAFASRAAGDLDKVQRLRTVGATVDPVGPTMPKISCLRNFWTRYFLVVGVEYPTVSSTTHTTVTFRPDVCGPTAVGWVWHVSEYIF